MGKPVTEEEETRIVGHLVRAQEVLLDVYDAVDHVVTADDDLLGGLQSLRTMVSRNMRNLHRAEIALDRHRIGSATSLGVKKVLGMLKGSDG